MTKHGKLQLLLTAGLITTTSLFCGVSIAQEKQDSKTQAEATLPTPTEVVDRFIKVTGGMEAYKAHKYRTAKGYFEMPAMGMRGAMVMHQATPNLMLVKIDLPQMGTISSGYNGTTGWGISPMQGPMIMESKELGKLKRGAEFFG